MSERRALDISEVCCPSTPCGRSGHSPRERMACHERGPYGPSRMEVRGVEPLSENS